MASIRKLGLTSSARLLAPLQVMGRAPSCRIYDADAHVSGVHAELRWDGARWLVEDLGSRNGTWLAGTRLRPRSPTVVTAGARIALGRPENAWLVESDEPPAPMAERQDGAVVLALDDCLALPDQDEPEVTVYLSHEGGWLMDTPEGAQRVRSGHVVTVRGEAWTLLLPEAYLQTLSLDAQVPLPRTVHLDLVVFPGLDQAEATVQHGVRAMPIGRRSGHQLLRLLVEARLADRAAGRSPHEEGWRDQVEVARTLGMQPNALNVAIHRLRRSFSAAGVEEAAGVVERRPHQGQLRLGITELELREG